MLSSSTSCPGFPSIFAARGLDARLARCKILLLSVLAFVAGTAGAHPQYTISTVNRYTKLVLIAPGQVRLTYVLMVGDGPALPLRRLADRDGDGHLSPTEAAALAAELRGQVERGLHLSVDGQPVSVAFAEPLLGLAGEAVAASAFSVDMQVVVPLPAGTAHTLRYEDRAALPPIGEVEYLLEEGPGVRLLTSQQGSGPSQQGDSPPDTQTAFSAPTGKTAPGTRFHFSGPPTSSLSDRSITARFSLPSPPSRAPLVLALGALLLLGGLVGWLALRPRLGTAAGPAPRTGPP